MTQSNFNQYPYYGYQQPYAAQPQVQAQVQPQPKVQVQPQPAFPMMPSGTVIPGSAVAPSSLGPQVPGMLPLEQSFIENILRLNKGKLATVYATFENNTEWNARIFKGIIEAAGRDHLILSDPETNTRYLIPMIYLDYVTFDEEIEYDYPSFGISQYSPR